jgi:Tol biopolymer transport system component
MNFSQPVPSTDGKKIFVVGEQRRGELVRYDLETQQTAPYLSGLSAEHLDFSRDGQWVAYVTYPEGNLWRSKLDGSQRLQLSFPPMRSYLPHWSPDGKKIVFQAESPGKPVNLHLVSAEGGSLQRLIPEERNQVDPSWAPDGNSLVFGELARLPGTTAIFLLDLRTHRVSSLPGSEGMRSPIWSPDGRYISAIRPSPTAPKAVLFDVAKQEWQELAKLSGWWSWSRDAKYVDLLSYGDLALYRVRIEGRKLDQLASLKDLRPTGVYGPWLGRAPDGSPLLLRDIGTQDIYALDWEAP